MARMRFRVTARMLFTWCMLAGLILLMAPYAVTAKFQFTFARLFRWPLTLGRTLTLSARTPQPPPGAANSRQAQYLNCIENLEAQLAEKQQKIETLSRMRENLYELQRAGLVQARVITASIDAAHAELVIDRGQADGITKEQFVLGDNSIIGTVCDVDTLHTKVRLFTDPAAKLETRIAELSITRLMKGEGNNIAKIQLVPTKFKVKKGDPVYVRAKPGLLPAPMIVGRVADCRQDDQKPLLWNITVAPACNLESIESVTVIIMNPHK